MKKKVITTLMLTCCLMLTAAFTLTGCGNSADEPNEGSWADEEWEDEDWEEDDIWDPYKEGMTLEEAKEWGESSVFIMDNDVFYPLMPARLGKGCVGAKTTYEEEIETGGFYYTTEEYSEYELPILSGDAKLVEVLQEKDNVTITYLPGKTGWTIPYSFSCSSSEFTDSEGYEAFPYIHAWDRNEYSENDTPDGVEIRQVNNKDLDFSELVHPATADGEEISSDELSKLNAQIEANSLKPVFIDLTYSEMILVYDAKKGEEVELSYRDSGSVDTETAYEYAYYRYFNLPTDIIANKPEQTYEGKYVETEDGYSIIETEPLEAGIHLYDTDSTIIPYVFEVK